MAKITDPDNLARNTEVVYDTSGFTIRLLIAGNLSSDGVSLQCVYSFCREQWKTQADLVKYPFPLDPIDGPSAGQFLLKPPWAWYDSTTTDLIKDAGWAKVDANDVSEEEWMNITVLTPFDDEGSDTAQYKQESGGSLIAASLAGAPNQAIKVYGDVSNGNFDVRDFFTIYINEYSKDSNSYDLIASQNLTALTFKKYGVPLSNPANIYVSADEATAGAYAGISINSGTSTITVSQAHTIQEIYDYSQHWKTRDAQVDEDYPIITYDGTTFILNSYTLILQADMSQQAIITGAVELDGDFDVSDLAVTGDMHIDTGAASTLQFTNVDVSGSVYNDSSYTLTLNLDGSSITAGDPGTGAGETNTVNTVTVKVIAKDAVTKLAIANARVFLKVNGGDTIFNDLADVNGEVTTITYNYTTDTDVVGRVRYGAAPYYKTGQITGTITSAGFETTILMAKD